MRSATLGLLLLACAPVLAAAQAPGAPAASGPVSPLVAAARAAQAAREAKGAAPAAKVWTIDDLEALKLRHQSQVNVLSMPGTGAIVTTQQGALPEQASPAGVADRYRELLTQAEAEIAKLERERLAGTNPYLRGMAGEKTRTVPQIDADLAKWRERRDVAARYSGAAP
jgi:hypothetical protein